MRLRLDLSYDGTDFSGWATQPGLRTVQATLEEALVTVLRLPRVRVTVAGRTDAGVHARGQVAHVDVHDDALTPLTVRSNESPELALVRRLAGILPRDLRVRRVAQAPPGFDARYSASWRRYAYRVVDDLALADPLLRRHVLTWPQPLDLGAMNAAAAKLTGLSDFAAFCRKREGATTIRTLLELNWKRNDAGLAVATVVADAFCHNMVRALVGCLLAVGDGRRPQSWPAEVLAARTRHGGVTVIPAHGLTLEEVRYPEGAELAAQAVRAQARRTAL